jgi:uncharacterized integral membrane protein
MNGAWARIGIVAACSALAAGFALLNADTRVPLRLGIVGFRSVPLTSVVFLSILLGMGLVFFAGLRADLKTRRMLRRYREALGEGWRDEVMDPEDDRA